MDRCRSGMRRRRRRGSCSCTTSSPRRSSTGCEAADRDVLGPLAHFAGRRLGRGPARELPEHVLRRARLQPSRASVFVDIDDGALDLRTVSRAGSPSGRANGAVVVQLEGAVLRNRPVDSGRQVIVARPTMTTPRGGRLDRHVHGAVTGHAAMPPVKATPLAVADAIVVVDVIGNVHCLDTTSGRTRWVDKVADPLPTGAYTTPACDGISVYAGDQRSFRAIDLETGVVRWRRDRPRAASEPRVARFASGARRSSPRRVLAVATERLRCRRPTGRPSPRPRPAQGTAMSGLAGDSPVGDPLLSADGSRLYVPAGWRHLLRRHCDASRRCGMRRPPACTTRRGPRLRCRARRRDR